MNIYDLETPVLLTDLDVLERNIASMAAVASAGGKGLRPHTKTHKTLEIARMQMQAGAIGLTVAKLGEAEVFADAGFDSIFVANEIVGPAKVDRLLALIQRVQLSVGVDSIAVAEPIGREAQSRGMRVPCLIEVDTGLGRAGTREDAETLELARYLVEHDGLEFSGIFTHEGQLYRIKKPAERKQAATQIAQNLEALAGALEAQGTPAGVISVGSTPGAALLANEAAPSELRPGVYVFNDRMQVGLGVEADRCALTVLATVVSVRPDGRVLLDAGTKSMASDVLAYDGCYGAILGRPELTFVAASEEHGWLQVQGRTEVRVGDRVRILPNHACTCVNMHDSMTAHRGETVEDVWPIAARGKIK